MQTTYTETQVFEQLQRHPAVPVFYHDDLSTALQMV
jgi:2-keto-3-deoxy-6-phosphogluconate aldolase